MGNTERERRREEMRDSDGGGQEEDRKPGFLFQVITSHYQPGLFTKRLQTCVEEDRKLLSTGLFLLPVCCGQQ